MTFPPLTIVPAGAGSGKTFYIQKTLAEWIKNGLAPEKIVAVTFTESAAAELRGRIRTELVQENQLDKALKLDQAYISTIHSFGLRFITEFAFDGGISPQPRLLNDDEQAMLVSRALATSPNAAAMMENLDRYGYRYDFMSETSPEESFRKGLLSFIATLRGIGKDTGSEKLFLPAEQKIRELYGEIRLAEHLKDSLLQAVNALLLAFPNDLSKECDLPPTVAPAVRKNYYDIKQAAKGSPLDSDWKLWKNLRGLKTYKNKSKFPAGYDDLALEVIAAADALPLHPGPLQSALEHAHALIHAAAETLGYYIEEKTSRGLVDFTDMLSQAHHLMCSAPEVLTAFRDRVDCLVVDEFQDTNPLQFSLLWALTRQGVPTIVVGDLKQAIMGFQGADARLLQNLSAQNPDNTNPLDKNYRSSRQLMNWINLVSAGLFPDYTVLEPKAEFDSKLSPLEVIEARKTLKDDVCASHTVARITELLKDKSQTVFDKKQNCYRQLQGADIAIICPTNRRLEYYAAALRNAGIRSHLPQNGWFESRIVQLAFYALSYVADPGDTHAALYLSVTELGSHTLESALNELIANKKLIDPLLQKLDMVTFACLDQSVGEILDDVVKEMDLYGVISKWPDAVQCRANLLRLQEECREFGSANREAMACGGYYGSDIKTFLAWLKGRVERDNSQPEAAVIDEEAVQLMTWHKSKGREWPIVAVCGMDNDTSPRLPTTRVSYRDFDDLNALLDKAQIEIFPDFAARETADNFKAELATGSRDAATRVLYVALTRAREKVIIEWPGYQEGKDSGSYWEVLSSSAGLALEANRMKIGDSSVECRIMVVDTEPQELVVDCAQSEHPLYGRRCLVSRPLPSNLTPEAKTPSAMEGTASVKEISVCIEEYGSGLNCELPVTYAERGTLIHRAFELIMGHPERVSLLSDAVELPLDSTQEDAIASVVASFDEWLHNRLQPQTVPCEVPILSIDQNGTVISGTADMVAETSEGFWIIDHKSDLVEDKQERFIYYLPQLECYAEAISKARSDKPVKGIAINWVSYGLVSLMELP